TESFTVWNAKVRLATLLGKVTVFVPAARLGRKVKSVVTVAEPDKKRLTANSLVNSPVRVRVKYWVMLLFSGMALVVATIVIFGKAVARKSALTTSFVT